MDEELHEMYVQRLKVLMEEIPKWDPSSDEAKALVAERAGIQKDLAEYDRLTQAAYDEEENRKIELQKAEQQARDEEENRKIELQKAETQAKADKRKSLWGLVGSVVTAVSTVGCAILAFAGLKSNQNFTRECNDMGVNPDKNIHSKDPRMNFR